MLRGSSFEEAKKLRNREIVERLLVLVFQSDHVPRVNLALVVNFSMIQRVLVINSPLDC